MSPRRTLMLLVLFAFAGRAGATEVQFRLVDQDGAAISGSTFNTALGAVRENVTITLEPGTYQVTVRPGILGQIQNAFLRRFDTVVVQGPEQIVELVWTTANLSLTLVDDEGDELPGTTWLVPGFAAVISGSRAHATLPVTHDPGTAPIQGIYSSGYPLELYPGIFGWPQQSLLFRIEPVSELPEAGDSRNFEWQTGDLALRLEDGGGNLIAGSRFGLPGIPAALAGPSLRVSLPVTVDPTHPFIGGQLTTGYAVTVIPGLLGAPQLGLWRVEPPVPLGVGGNSRNMVWPLANLALSLSDQDGLPVEGSAFSIAGAAILPGPSALTALPVTEDPTAPPLSGPLAGGYPIEVRPGINGQPQTDRLRRTEPAHELEAGGGARALVWEMTRGTLHVVGGDGTEIAGASLQLAGFVAEQPTGGLVALPVNDLGTDPPHAGEMAGAYPFELRPGDGEPLDGPFTFAFGPDELITPSYVPLGDSHVGLRFNLCSATLSLDGDSIADCDDNCPGAANEDQADQDGDSTGDVCDSCPLAFEAVQTDADTDGSGDACDNCPGDANADQADLDTDNVGNACDNCPSTNNTGQTDLDSDGTGNACDLDDGMIFVATPTAERLEWDAEAGHGVWNVYRGDLGVLRAGGDHSQAPGSNDLATRFCGLVETALDDSLAPEPDRAGFYLVTGLGTTETGLGADSTGTPRPHANPCP